MTPRHRSAIVSGLMITAAAALSGPPAHASSPPADPAGTLALVAEADTAVDAAWRPDDEAMYVVEKGGSILQVAGDTVTPVLDIGDLVSDGSEQGLLGLTFSADGTLAFINYTDTNGDTVVAELAVSADGLAFDRDNMRPLITIEQPYANHNGGDVVLGPDGMLYIGMGDGGAGGDPDRNAQDLGDLLGKMLRIEPTPSAGMPYTIPGDNPFVGVEGARGEIWSIGLRNPWRFSFDAETGDLWIADVGQNAVEEIDVAAAADGIDAGKGANFGWSAFEGESPYNEDVSVEQHHPPIAAYGHDGGRCSISGGVRARGAGAGSFAGWYVFADYCSGEVFALEPSADLASGRVIPILTSPGGAVTAVVAGPDGSVYVLDGDGVQLLQPA